MISGKAGFMRCRWIRFGSCGTLVFVAVSFILVGGATADRRPGTAPTGPLSPQEELRTFYIPKGFRIELVACEPNVVDPVAIAFDEHGRLFVAEMRGYPNAGVATG